MLLSIIRDKSLWWLNILEKHFFFSKKEKWENMSVSILPLCLITRKQLNKKKPLFITIPSFYTTWTKSIKRYWTESRTLLLKTLERYPLNECILVNNQTKHHSLYQQKKKKREKNRNTTLLSSLRWILSIAHFHPSNNFCATNF